MPALAHAAKNEILLLLLNSIRGALRENVRVLVTRHSQAVENAMYYHRRITQAIQHRSAADARANMRLHLESVASSCTSWEALQKNPEK